MELAANDLAHAVLDSICGRKPASLDRRAPGPRGTCLEHFLEKREWVRSQNMVDQKKKEAQVSGRAGPHVGIRRPNFLSHRLAAVRFRRWRDRLLPSLLPNLELEIFHNAASWCGQELLHLACFKDENRLACPELGANRAVTCGTNGVRAGCALHSTLVQCSNL
jgi:hypothetical protein